MFPLLFAARAALVLAFALAALPLLRRRSAGARRLLLVTALTGALVAPLAATVAPGWHVAAPIPEAVRNARILAEAPTTPTAEPSAAPEITPPPADAAPARTAPSLATLALLGWALGAAVLLLRLGLDQRRTWRLVRDAVPATGWATALARATRVTGVRAEIRETDAVDVPAVAGVLRPVVLVPLAAADWSADRRHAVLLHELAHVARRDCLFQLVARVACALHWFDPLVWLAARRLRLERELAADEAVLGAGTSALGYAEELVAVAADAHGAPPAGVLGIARSRSELERRVRALVANRAPALLRGEARAVLGLSSLVLVGAACTTPAARPAVMPTTGAITAAPVAKASPATARDPALQRIAEEELDRALHDTQAVAGTVLVLAPATGEILAEAGKDHGGPADIASGRAYVTGSTLKGVTLAAALGDHVVTPSDRFDGEGGSITVAGKKIVDPHAGHGVMTLPEMIAVSSNVGFAKLFGRIGGERLGRWFRAFHFGAAPAVEGAVSGWIPARIVDNSYEGAEAAIGEAITASPLQIAAAYATFANGGEYVAPTRDRRTTPAPRERVLDGAANRQLVAMLEGVVRDGTGSRAHVEGVRVAGKTGTAGWERPDGTEGTWASFVGFFPVEAPKLVMLVGLEQPVGETAGGQVAAPVFARVAARALAR